MIAVIQMALKYFEMASSYDFSDGELWLFIGNLKEDKFAYYNKALFKFKEYFIKDVLITKPNLIN